LLSYLSLQAVGPPYLPGSLEGILPQNKKRPIAPVI